MAVLQISRIQHRRGLQQDLPQLASAELGWSIDQRRLFIGNGTLGEGAPIQGVTEILTQHTDIIDAIKFYIFKGEEGGFISQTGPTPSAPTVRSLQHKFDDFVSVRDFGATGDGVTNDIDAIYRAFTQIYKADQTPINPKARRTIYFPAGTYNIGASPEHPYGVILVPPWCRLVGDGIDSTIIVQTDASQDCALRFCDSSFVYDTSIGLTPFIAMPANISIENLTLHQASNRDIMYIDNVVNVNFRLVKFSGVADWTNYLTPSAMKFNAYKVTPSNITFESCQFTHLGYAVISDADSNNVRFNDCSFTKLFSAFRLGQNSVNASAAPNNFRISNSIFDNITYYAIDSWPYATGIVSTGNSYYSVNGTGLAINFQSNGNYSINDYFDNNDDRVGDNNNQVIQIKAKVGAVLGTATLGTGGQVTILKVGNAATTISLPPAGVFNYTLTNGAVYRAGTLSFTNDEFTETFTSDSALADVTLSVVSNTIHYNNTYGDLSLRYNINHF